MYICSALGQTSTCSSQEDFPNMKYGQEVAIQKGQMLNIQSGKWYYM